VPRIDLLRRLAVLLAACMGCVSAACAGIADAPGSELEVALVTYGPGDIYWERFGHDAIEIRDHSSGEAVAFNYGMFDFNQAHFLLNFARGRMRYSMDAVTAADDAAFYAGEGRSVTRQTLALAPAQAAALRDALLWNLRPENAPYDYDYFRANCATRVRDALDRALGGQLRTQWQGVATQDTYRNQTDRLMAPQPWLMLLLDLGLGPDADQPLSLWQAAFVPMTLAHAVAGATIDDGPSGRQPLQSEARTLAEARLPFPPAQAPDWHWRFLAIGIVLGALLAWCGLRRRDRSSRVAFSVIAGVFALLAGLAGLGMAVLWAFTAHRSAWANQNLLLFSPLAFVLLPTLWRLRRPTASIGRSSFIVAAVLTASAAFALVGKPLLPYQHNLAWIALALPIWCGLLIGLRQRRQTA
jgi:hypothetical protein